MNILTKGDWLIRHVEETDASILAKWLSDSRVLVFYEGRDNSFTLHDVQKEFIHAEDHLERCIIMYKQEAIGYIQIYPLDEATQKLYGIHGESLYGMDQFIGEPDYWNQGLGSELVATMAAFIVDERHAAKVYMDPQLRNPRALRAYEKAGFRKVKPLPNHE